MVNIDINYKETVHEVALWRAVLAQAIFDISKSPVTSNQRKSNGNAILKCEWDRVYHWIFNDQSGDFYEVCDLAGVNPSSYRKRVKMIMDGKEGIEYQKYKKGFYRRKVRFKNKNIISDSNINLTFCN